MYKKILVTGADGFIGSHLVELLLKKNYNVRALVQYNSFSSWGWLDTISEKLNTNLDVVSGDIRDSNFINDIVKDCDAVLHLAALIAIPYSYKAPQSYIDTNILGTLNLLQASVRNNIRRFIQTSTSEVYGTAKFVPITEDHPLSGQSPYAASKIGSDQLAYSFFASFGLPVVILRPFNTYGPRQSARAVIPTIISQIANGVKEIKLGSLKPTRDFNYVLDTVRGFLHALESDAGLGEVINIGSNFEISVEDTFYLIKEIMNADVNISLDNSRLRPENSEVERLFSCNKKANELFGWSPEYGGLNGLKLGLEETIKWFTVKSNLDHYKTDIFNY